MSEVVDVVVVGSGSAGMATALRLRDFGLSVLIVEKAHKLGGTSATSGGVAWIPCHGLQGSDDNAAQAMEYLESVTQGSARRDKLETYVEEGGRLVRYLGDQGINLIPMPWPDYFSEEPGARADRSLVLPMFDGRKLGSLFPLIREQYPRFKLFNRYSMNLEETFAIASRSPGWTSKLVGVISRYWLDRGTRKLTRRDRWFTSGLALMGPLTQRVVEKGVEIRLETALQALDYREHRVCGVRVSRFGTSSHIETRYGVVICSGGYEWSQKLRDRFFKVPGSIWWSSTPQGATIGEGLLAAEALGAATEYTDTAWWAPTMNMPSLSASNFEETHQAVFDVGRPFSVCVNRNGDRFVDESCSYDNFGKAMINDQLSTGANAPCWLVFDAKFRAKFTAGGLLPAAIMPDRSIPVDWWDHYMSKAETVADLARKIGIDGAKLEAVVGRMNTYAASGEDPEFARGSSIYDRSFGDPTVAPNPCLGPIDKPPFYAVQINLGDLGTKGGLKTDTQARVLNLDGDPIEGLYAAGNASGNPFGDCYPGAGATIGPAMVFGYLAANHIGARASNDVRLDGAAVIVAPSN